MQYELISDSAFYEICFQAEARVDPIAFFIEGTSITDAVANALMRADVQEKIANYPTERFWVSIIPARLMQRRPSVTPEAVTAEAAALTTPPAAPSTTAEN